MHFPLTISSFVAGSNSRIIPFSTGAAVALANPEPTSGRRNLDWRTVGPSTKECSIVTEADKMSASHAQLTVSRTNNMINYATIRVIELDIWTARSRYCGWRNIQPVAESRLRYEFCGQKSDVRDTRNDRDGSELTASVCRPNPTRCCPTPVHSLATPHKLRSGARWSKCLDSASQWRSCLRMIHEWTGRDSSRGEDEHASWVTPMKTD